ncbi:hypothetical protein KEM48_013717 [Puccinia striiformis f. sp. tritici PST-130]|nr:hypothetical protein KEM48_013717 [Puccinia striiformis f. sp. tritici PST-130]
MSPLIIDHFISLENLKFNFARPQALYETHSSSPSGHLITAKNVVILIDIIIVVVISLLLLLDTFSIVVRCEGKRTSPSLSKLLKPKLHKNPIKQQSATIPHLLRRLRRRKNQPMKNSNSNPTEASNPGAHSGRLNRLTSFFSIYVSYTKRLH